MLVREDDLQGAEVVALLRAYLAYTGGYSPAESMHALDLDGLAWRPAPWKLSRQRGHCTRGSALKIAGRLEPTGWILTASSWPLIYRQP